MKLTIEINNFENGIEMENNFNKAVADLGEALKKKGFGEMELIAFNESIETAPIYKITLLK